MSAEFLDYYAILGVAKNSSAAEIKSAFKKLALYWHPDRNTAAEATRKMQDINEAKFILLDTEARQKFDLEAERYQAYKNKRQHRQAEQRQNEQQQRAPQNEQRERQQADYNEPYYVQDDILSRWIYNARRQAELAIKDLKGMSRAGYEDGKNELFRQIIAFTLMFIIVALIGFFIKR